MKRVFAIFFPVLLLAFWVLSLEFEKRSGTEYHLKIEGYDPRDLLSGHYLQFRLTFLPGSECSGADSERTCACFASSADNPKVLEGVEVKNCIQAAEECPVYIEGSCSRGRFLAGLERYYIPEELAPALSVIPDKATALVALNGNGKAAIKGLMVGQETIEEYARKKSLER